MPDQVSYSDAAKILGAGDSKLLKALDIIVGGVLLGAIGLPNILSWFDAKSEFSRLSHDLVARLGAARVGASGVGQIEKIYAAHAVLALSAFVDQIPELGLPFRSSDLKLTKGDAIRLAGGGFDLDERGTSLVQEFLTAPVPLPSPIEERSVFRARLVDFYSGATNRLAKLIEGLAIWDKLNARKRSETISKFEQLPRLAYSRYDSYFLKLASTVPELACWANWGQHEATQSQVSAIATSLRRVEDVLTLGAGRDAPQRWAGIARANRAELELRVAESSDDFGLLTFPTLGSSYVDPKFRVAAVVGTENVAQHEFWEHLEPRSDLSELLVGILLTPEALKAPTVVLGHPGSGKSALTKVLAARLPCSRFMAVRVPLRDVPADADIQEQIETIVRQSTGSSVQWDSLSGNTEGAVPVVMLDGFDELLQATGVSQSDYLVRVAEFQRREQIQGRPTVVLVTSRTTVADRARLPRGAAVIRLEPFDEKQIARWVAVWNDENARYFPASGLKELSVERVLTYRELAEQPLLLLILAIYDADQNGLQLDSRPMDEADLFEALLRQFAVREVAKSGTYLSQEQIEREVQKELMQLAVVAAAMFNRGLQFATEEQIESDLHALLGGRRDVRIRDHGFRQPLSRAEEALSRFFFVQRSSAISGGRGMSTYEFLHAKFGEYLVARLVWTRIREMVTEILRNDGAIWANELEPDRHLFRLLSYALISERVPILGFLSEMSSRLAVSERESWSRALVAVLAQVSGRNSDSSTEAYAPQLVGHVRRSAVYNANLVMLSLICHAGPVRLQDLVADANPLDWWRRHSLLWRSQLKEEEWNGLLDRLWMEKEAGEDSRRVVLHIGSSLGESTRGSYSNLTFAIDDRDEPFLEDVFVWERMHEANSILSTALFMCDTLLDYSLQAVGPLYEILGALNGLMVTSPTGSRGLPRLVMEVLLGLTEKDSASRQRTYLRLINLILILDRDDRENNQWEQLDEIRSILYVALRSDEQVTPELALRAVGGGEGVNDYGTSINMSHELCARRAAQLLLAKLGIDENFDEAILYRLRYLFDRFDFPEELHIEAWITLAELDFLRGNDWAWTDTSVNARKGYPFPALDENSRNLERRLRFIAQRRAESESPSNW